MQLCDSFGLCPAFQSFFAHVTPIPALFHTTKRSVHVQSTPAVHCNGADLQRIRNFPYTVSITREYRRVQSVGRVISSCNHLVLCLELRNGLEGVVSITNTHSTRIKCEERGM